MVCRKAMTSSICVSESCEKAIIEVPGEPERMVFLRASLDLPSQKEALVKSVGAGWRAMAAGPLPSALAP